MRGIVEIPRGTWMFMLSCRTMTNLLCYNQLLSSNISGVSSETSEESIMIYEFYIFYSEEM